MRHAMNKSQKHEILLYFSVIILAILSAYTTAEGFSLIWVSDYAYVSLISWAFALAISSFLVYGSLRLHFYFRQGKAIGIITAYVMFATLSLFFNFNAIYGKFITKDILDDQVKSARINLTSLYERAINEADNKFELSFWTKKVDSLDKKAIAESKNVLRPGKDWRYQGLIDKKTDAMANLDESKRQYEIFKDKIYLIYDKTISLIDSSLVNKDEEFYRYAVYKSIEGYNNIGSIAKQNLKEFIFNKIIYNENTGEPDFALNTLLSFITLDPELSKKENTKIFLALFISFLLDFPIFFALVIIHWPKYKKSSSGIFSDDENSSQPNIWD